MGWYYDRTGWPISLKEWVERRRDEKYQRVDETTLPDGRWISTVWLGLDESFGGSAPMIFETMVFSSREVAASADLDSERYATEAEAIAGHQGMVEKWRARRLP